LSFFPPVDVAAPLRAGVPVFFVGVTPTKGGKSSSSSRRILFLLHRLSVDHKITMVKQHELTELSDSDLKKKLEELREELARHRVTQAANPSATKVSRIGELRKDIARTLTFINTKVKEALKAKLSGSKYLPKDMRAKATRAIRRRLTKDETHVRAKGPKGAAVKKMVPRMTVRQAKKAMNRKRTPYAVLAEA
jgi:large subunit ribosomal protein L35e